MRAFLVLIVLAGGGYWFFDRLDLEPFRMGPSASGPAASGKPAAQTEPLTEDLPEAHFRAFGMPDLNTAWDAPALKTICESLDEVCTANPRNLPGARSAYGKAFFSKLRYTVQRFHLQSSTNKVATYNAFNDLLPVYIKARKAGVQCDMEIALLVGLTFEIMTGFSEDQQFVRDISRRSTRISRDLDGNYWEVWGSSIHPLGTPRETEREVQLLLHLMANPDALRPEARILALSHVSLHLPTLVRRMGFTSIRPTLTKLRAAEMNPQARDYYDAMITRLS